MADDDQSVPTLAEWAGGPGKLAALTERFYQKVSLDPVLEPVFRHMDLLHAAHVATFITEVLGGEAQYSASGGSHAGMISHHLGRHLTEVLRRQWIALMLDTADEVGLPDDPEFRAAFVGYLEWGTRLAVINSAEGVVAPQDDPPMPKWSWGPPGGPYQP
jgi:hemoglobin